MDLDELFDQLLQFLNLRFENKYLQACLLDLLDQKVDDIVVNSFLHFLDRVLVKLNQYLILQYNVN